MSSSESDGEISANLKEAVSEELKAIMTPLPTSAESLLKKPPMQNKSVMKTQKLCKDDNVNQRFIKTTPEFRKHLSQKLSNYLDSIIEINETQSVVEEDIYFNGGIKLLNSSSKTLRDVETTEFSNKNNVKKNGTLSSDSDDSEKFAEVAVSGADVLKGGEGAFTQSNGAVLSSGLNLPKKTKKKKLDKDKKSAKKPKFCKNPT